jgi:hypothetical protein
MIKAAFPVFIRLDFAFTRAQRKRIAHGFHRPIRSARRGERAEIKPGDFTRARRILQR